MLRLGAYCGALVAAASPKTAQSASRLPRAVGLRAAGLTVLVCTTEVAFFPTIHGSRPSWALTSGLLHHGGSQLEGNMLALLMRVDRCPQQDPSTQPDGRSQKSLARGAWSLLCPA